MTGIRNISASSLLFIALLMQPSICQADTSQADSSRTANTAVPIAVKLGLPADSRLLIIHADDVGMSHAVNTASFSGLLAGHVNSASMMVPCSWFAEAAAFYRQHNQLDMGLHLTLTSEWQHYRWQSLSVAGAHASLHNAAGYQYQTNAQVVANASGEDVKRELQAQIDAARAHGIEPTHLDSHMGTLFARPDFFQAYVEVGRENQLPVLIPRHAMAAQAPALLAKLAEEEVLLDHLIMAQADLPAEQWADFYRTAIRTLQPGVSQIIVHLGQDNPELQAITINHPDYGAAWRARDSHFFALPETSALLAAENITLVTWRQLGELLYPDKIAPVVKSP